MTSLSLDDRISVWGLEDLQSQRNWQERLYWPVPTRDLYDRSQKTVAAVMGAVRSCPDELTQQVAVVGALRCINAFIILLEAAIAADAELDGSPQIAGGPPELELMRGNTSLETVDGRDTSLLVAKKPTWPLLRSLARTASWTAWHRLPRALVSPDATAITHNGLLRESAKRGAVYFNNAETLLDRARRASSQLRDEDVAENATQILCAATMTAAAGLSDRTGKRLHQATTLRFRHILKPVAYDVAAIRSLRGLPLKTWSGTGGPSATRLVNSEVLRRGGEATGFDHGSDTAISQMPEITALLELAVTSKFMVATREWKSLLERSPAPGLVAGLGASEFGHGDGEPLFRAACRNVRKATASRPRVLYVIHPFRGHHQYALPYPPDALYWDFQSRVARALLKQPVDLLCKPHPEGLLVGKSNPIEAIAPTSYRRFEEHLVDTDVFLFDAPTSTTFAEALCTNSPVVWLDRGYHPINPSLHDAMNARCRILKATTSPSTGRLMFDEDELADAVMGPHKDIDPTYFRQLLAGTGA